MKKELNKEDWDVRRREFSSRKSLPALLSPVPRKQSVKGQGEVISVSKRGSEVVRLPGLIYRADVTKGLNVDECRKSMMIFAGKTW